MAGISDLDFVPRHGQCFLFQSNRKFSLIPAYDSHTVTLLTGAPLKVRVVSSDDDGVVLGRVKVVLLREVCEGKDTLLKESARLVQRGGGKTPGLDEGAEVWLRVAHRTLPHRALSLGARLCALCVS